MKKTILIIVSIIMVYSFDLFSQVPDAFKYQAVLRNVDGEIISGQEISLKISILNESSTGEVVYSEEHSKTTSDLGMVSLNIGDGTIISGNFQSIAWGEGDKFLKIEIDESGGSSFSSVGTFQLLSVPYALYANSATKLGNNAVYSPSTDTLFVVKDHEGNIVFAVYPDGAEVIANETAKGKIGGFAVSGRTSTKSEEEYFRITPDSSRIYVNELSSKGKVGGFAVSGRTSTKGLVNDYLFVTADSTRIYVNDSISNKGKIGGFAVSGRTSTKGEISSLMSLTRDNYFIGHEAGKSNTDGFYNSFMGYKTGFSNTEGNNGIFLGYKSGYNNTTGSFNTFVGNYAGHANTTGAANVFIGDSAGVLNTSGGRGIFLGTTAGRSNTTGMDNIFIGQNAGYYNTTGYRNLFMGTHAGYENTEGRLNIFLGVVAGRENTVGERNIFIGQGSGLMNDSASYNVFIGDNCGTLNTKGESNVFIGYLAARGNESGNGNVYIGEGTAYSNQNGNNNVYIGRYSGYFSSGSNNVFIGPAAGIYETGSSRLYIENSEADSTSALIWGNFDNDILGFNASVGIGTISPSEKLEVVDGNIRVTSGSFIDDGETLNVPDYVFEPNYNLESIEEHAKFMWEHKHLPAVKSAKDIKKSDGYNISERREQILEELEKAHIYIEQLNNQIKELKITNNQIINRLEAIEKELIK